MQFRSVPYFTRGRGGYKPLGIVIHVSEGSYSSLLNEFDTHEKSAHYVVKKDGTPVQLVKEENTAYAQGTVVDPTAKLVLDRPGVNPNNYFISIEHEGSGSEDFTPQQYDTTSDMIQDICTRFSIPLDADHVIPHRAIRSDKTCPGPVNMEKLIAIATVKEKLVPMYLQVLLMLKQKIDNFLKGRR